MQKYYIIPLEIVAKFQRTQRENNLLCFTQTIHKDWVINVNCGEFLFLEINWSSFKIVELDTTDFPQPEL